MQLRLPFRFIHFISHFILLITIAHAQNPKVTLELQQVDLAAAVRLLGNSLHMNVMVSPNVKGTATIHLQEALPEQAFDLLLSMHGLTKWQTGSIWYIATREELIKRELEEQKWHDAQLEAAPLVTYVWQIKYAKAEEISRILQDEHASFLSKRGRMRVDNRTNSLCIEDVVEVIAKIKKLLISLDVPVQQIGIEARLASVDQSMERELGINFAVASDNSDHSSTSVTVPSPDLGKYSLAVIKLANGSLLDVKLAALENTGHAELISSPSLFTENQQPASIEAGEEVPYQQVSDSGGTAIVFKKAVLGLRVTPQIMPGHKVLLQLQINQDRPSSNMVLGMPTISTRQIMTNVLVKSGQTIVLGGIYEKNNEIGQRRVPFISQVPVLGWLFKQQDSKESKRELLVFVTPKIIAQ